MDVEACPPGQSSTTRPLRGISPPPGLLLVPFFNIDRAAAHRHLGADCGLPRGPWTRSKALVCAMHRFQAVPAQNRALRRGNAAFGHPRSFAVFFRELYNCHNEYSHCMCQHLFLTGFFKALLLPAHSFYRCHTSSPRSTYMCSALSLVSAASFTFPRRYGPILVAAAVSVF